MHITNKDLMFQPLVINDISVVELLIKYRYKYDDNLFLGNDNVFDVSGVKAINQEVIATYASLDDLIKKCNFNKQQNDILKYIEQGYTYREIGKLVGVDFRNIKKTLKSLYSSIVRENEREWRKVTYINVLDLITKQCNKCKENLPATDEFFSPEKRNIDGFHSNCKKCRNLTAKKIRQNRECND